ncbi:MAG: hypothetical protein ABIA62_06005 [Candidatus Woesearchaeota archaeon]
MSISFSTIFFISFSTIFFILSVISSYAITPGSSGIESDSDLGDATSVLQDGAAGYWIAYDEQGYGYATGNTLGTFYQPVSGSSPLTIPVDGTMSYIYDNLLKAVKADAAGFSLYVPDIYNIFKVTEGSHELQHAIFVLYPSFFTVGASWYDSHLGTVDSSFADFQNPCVTCPYIDDMTACNFALPVKGASCIDINILNSKNCDIISDTSQSFCEGVVGIGGNANPLVNPDPVRIPGYGGCRMYDTEGFDVNTPRPYGRDWYPASSVVGGASMYSPDLGAAPNLGTAVSEAAVGQCCGNDLRADPGVTAVDPAFPLDSDSYNKFLCVNETDYRPQGDFRWIDASQSEVFRIKYVKERDGAPAQYALASNADGWLACNTDQRDTSEGGNNLEDIYLFVDWQLTTSGQPTKIRNNGMLLKEYEGLPRPSITNAYGTDALDGSPTTVEGADGGAGLDSPGSPVTDALEESDFVNSIVPNSITGPSVVSPCDTDGDGYDAPWTTDLASEWKDTDTTCKNPIPPFDCDEDNVDGRLRHPGQVDYCDGSGESKIDNDYDCNPSTPCVERLGPTSDMTNWKSFVTPVKAFPRFICYNNDAAGDFAECCGWSTAYCFNEIQGRRVGSFIHTLREFNFFGFGGTDPINRYTIAEDDPAYDDYIDRSEMNYVMRYGVNPAVGNPAEVDDLPEGERTYRMPFAFVNNDINLTDFGHYGTLEFYVWFTTNFEVELWMGQYLGVKPRTKFDAYSYPYKIRIVDYVVNEPELMKWMHVVIPIEGIVSSGFQPENLVLASDIKRLRQLKTEVKAKVNEGGNSLTKPYSNIIGIDKIHLKPNATDPNLRRVSGAEDYMCTSTETPRWISDLDDTTQEEGDMPYGMYSCDAVPSYGWTGTMCCGDDTGNNTKYSWSQPILGKDTFKETYNDSKAACWSGNLLPEGSRAMLVKYNLSYSGFSGEITRLCQNTTCTYNLPPVENAIVTNNYTEVYDLAFFSLESSIKMIGVGGIAPNDHAYLKAFNVPLQVQFHAGQFYSCNAEKYINDTPNTITNQFLIPTSNAKVSTGGACAVVGDYFCEHADGRNLGWSFEKVKMYPKSTNVSIDATTSIKVKESETDDPVLINATYRVNRKGNYNLVMNGGFENV